MTARFIVSDVFEGLATLEDDSVDLVVTSPPFLALRSYLPADHPDKSKEIGSEPTPARFLDTLLAVTAELRRVLAPHGSICVELGDTYSGASGWESAGDDSWSAGPNRMAKEEWRARPQHKASGPGWPLAKSRALIPQLYEIALAYGINPLTGQPSPAEQWRIRNVVTWARPNPPVGALGDKWRPATSDLIVACTSSKRYWDDLATRKAYAPGTIANSERVGYRRAMWREGRKANDEPLTEEDYRLTQAGAPLLDYWEIPPGGYKGSHYAVFPEELVVPCVKAMCPEKVCRTCGEPSRRILSEPEYLMSRTGAPVQYFDLRDGQENEGVKPGSTAARRAPDGGANDGSITRRTLTLGFTDCGHDDYRPGIVLDPFAGSGTTLAVATGHGHDAIGIDLDERNADLAMERVGPFLMEVV